MIMKKFFLGSIPTLYWGKPGRPLIIAVHGHMSNKADVPIKMLAETADPKGWSVLSFDMSGYGERKDSPEICRVEDALRDLETVWEFAHTETETIRLFGCSQGAYFCLLAYQDRPIRDALFLSPVLDMGQIIQGIMRQSDISEDMLREQQTIRLPYINLYWEYYQYVKTHPILKWPVHTEILYGTGDTVCLRKSMEDFCRRFHAGFTLADSEHYFHTPGQLALYKEWLEKTI